MPIMSPIESTFCRSAAWGAFARRVVLPWALAGEELRGGVLEIGGGAGAMAATVARRFPEARLVVTDVDPAMVSAARRRLGGAARVEQADVTRLPYADGTFDVVTSYLMLHHVIDWEAALAEALRVLRPGGVLLGYDLADTGLARVVHRVDGSPHRLISPAQLREELGSAAVVETSLAGHLMRFRASR